MDNHYNDFKYNSGHKYGASSIGELEALAWGVEVDWDADGEFDGVNEADHLVKAPTIKRGRRTMIKPAGQGFEPIRTGQATVVLSNHDGRYDAWNTGSPIYPNVESGKDIRIRVLDQYTGTIHNRFYGIIQDIVPSGYGAEAIVTIYADDAMRTLRDTYATVNRPYPDGTLAPASLNAIMVEMITSIQWPTRWSYVIGGNAYSIRSWYANGDRSAGTELEDLALSFFGYLFISDDGRLKQIDKFTSQSSVMSVSQTEMLKDIGNPQPWAIRRNVVKLRFHVRRQLDNAIVWQPLIDDPSIGPGDTREYFVEYTYNGYPAHLENLETSFRFSSDPTTLAEVTATSSITDYGTKAFISITNTNAFPIWLYANPEDTSASYVRGDITWTEKSESISSPRNPSSVTNQRALVLDSLWYQNKNQAFDFVDEYQDFISIQHKTPIIQMENRFAKQFVPDLFEIVTVDIPYLGISSETFRVGGIEEESISETTQAVRTTFYLEPYLTQTAGAGLWGTGTWGTSKWSW